jgi:signal transduction histidine kinase
MTSENILSDDLVTVLVFDIPLFLLLGGFIIGFAFLSQRRRQQHKLEITEMRNKYEQELLRSQLEIQEQTLKTISQEIHDNIGQSLTLAKLQLHTLPASPGFEDIQPTRDLIAKSINDLRDLSKSLNPDRIADIGLVESIRHEMLLLEKTKAMQTSLEVSGTFKKVPPEKEIIVFRIFQEMMSNCIRHAQATRMDVRIEYLDENMMLSLTDNGKGFEDGYIKGVGINSMHSRANLISASLNIQSGGNGSTVTLNLPLNNAPTRSDVKILMENT